MNEIPAPLAIVMISLNEEHNLPEIFANLRGFAAEIFLVDSFSTDATVDLALANGVHVVQRRFEGFGEQWDYASNRLPITQPWTMKLDPDERLSDELKASIRAITKCPENGGFTVTRRLWFMGRPLPIRQKIVRGWRTGCARFEHVAVNEHPIVPGHLAAATGDMAHIDSPTLHHWFAKQNAYTTAEALGAYRKDIMAAQPNLFGTSLQRRMWLKALALRAPFAPLAFFLYYLVFRGAWRAGQVGFVWARLRGDVYRMIALKTLELELRGRAYAQPTSPRGHPHPRAIQASD